MRLYEGHSGDVWVGHYISWRPIVMYINIDLYLRPMYNAYNHEA